MAHTSNIGLNLTEDMSTEFSDWRVSIDGNNGSGNPSNMQIIDNTFGDQESVNGSATLLSSSWTAGDNASLTLQIAGLRSNDMTFIQGATQEDQETMDHSELYAVGNYGSITFYAKNKPMVDIDIIYFIVRGEI